MFSLKFILTSAFAFFSVAQSQQFLIQNWGNGEPTTNYTYRSLEAGRYTVDWILGAGGNFVVGKGYRGSQNLFVIPPKIRSNTRLIVLQRSQLHRQLQSPRQFISCSVWVHEQPKSRVLRRGGVCTAQSFGQCSAFLLRLSQQRWCSIRTLVQIQR